MSEIFDVNAAIYPFPARPVPLDTNEKAFYREKIKTLLKQRDAVLVAHYYTDPEIQALAEETGAVSPTHLKWLVLAIITRHQRYWLLVYVLWGKPPKFSIQRKKC